MQTKTSLRPPGSTRSVRHSYQFRSGPALFAIRNIPNAGHSASSFISRLKSFISPLGNSSSGFFFFFHLSNLPRLALNYSVSVSSPSRAAPLYLTPLFCHSYPGPLTPLLILLIRQESASPRPFHAALCFSTLPSQRWSLPLIFSAKSCCRDKNTHCFFCCCCRYVSIFSFSGCSDCSFCFLTPSQVFFFLFFLLFLLNIQHWPAPLLIPTPTTHTHTRRNLSSTRAVLSAALLASLCIRQNCQAFPPALRLQQCIC